MSPARPPEQAQLRALGHRHHSLLGKLFPLLFHSSGQTQPGAAHPCLQSTLRVRTKPHLTPDHNQELSFGVYTQQLRAIRVTPTFKLNYLMHRNKSCSRGLTELIIKYSLTQ